MEQIDAKGRRLILGFDAGCMTCSDLARRIEEQTRDELEVRSLRDPQVDHFRKEALGDNAPWAPTLIEIKGGKVRAWTGMTMGAVLSRRLGLIVTWRVMQVLGDVHGSARPRESQAASLTNCRRTAKYSSTMKSTVRFWPVRISSSHA